MKRLFVILVCLALVGLCPAKFMGFLQQNTSVTLNLGPFLDASDAAAGTTTKKTGLSIAAAAVSISKAGGVLADKHEGTACAEDKLGYYLHYLDATDTNTIGLLIVDDDPIADAIFPAWEYFVVDSYAYALLTHGVSADSIAATGASKLQTTGKALITEDVAQTSTTTTFYYSGSDNIYISPGAIVAVLTSGGFYEKAEVLSVSTGSNTVIFKYPLVGPPTDGGVMYLESSPSWKSIWRSLIRSAFGSNPN